MNNKTNHQIERPIAIEESRAQSPSKHLAGILRILPPELEPPPPDSPRGRIIEAARTLFAAHGFDGTSIRNIAETAEVNLAMVHYYFGAKKELYQRVIVTELVNAFRNIQADLPTELAPVDLLIELPIKMASIMRSNPVWAQLARRELAEGAPNARRVIEDMGVYGPRAFKQPIIEACLAASESEPSDVFRPEFLLPLLVTLGYGMVVLEPLIRIVIEQEITNDAIWEGRIKTMRRLLERGLKGDKRGEAK